MENIQRPHLKKKRNPKRLLNTQKGFVFSIGAKTKREREKVRERNSGSNDEKESYLYQFFSLNGLGV